MMALTICEPCGSAIVFGGKDVENRRRPYRIQGPVLVHAGRSLDWFTADCTEWVNDLWPACPASPLLAMHQFTHRLGRVIGVMYIDEVYEANPAAPRSPWETGPWCMHVLGVRPLKEPFKLRGQQGLFRVPGATLPQEAFDLADELIELAATAAERSGR